jgi:hypothetical protein
VERYSSGVLPDVDAVELHSLFPQDGLSCVWFEYSTGSRDCVGTWHIVVAMRDVADEATWRRLWRSVAKVLESSDYYPLGSVEVVAGNAEEERVREWARVNRRRLKCEGGFDDLREFLHGALPCTGALVEDNGGRV